MNTIEDAMLAAEKSDANLLDHILTNAPDHVHWEPRSESQNTLLGCAVKANSLECVDVILKHGGNVDIQDALGFTPLTVALSNDNSTMVQKLIDNGADVNLQSFDGFPPLISCKRLETINALLDNGANVNIVNGEESGVLHHFVSQEECTPEMFQRLIDAGADVNARDMNGRTPLHEMVITPHACELLLRHGADTTIKDNFGETCLEFGSPQSEHVQLIKATVQKVDAYHQKRKLLEELNTNTGPMSPQDALQNKYKIHHHDQERGQRRI